MHEIALATSIVDIVEATARSQGASRIRELRLEIGALANVEVDALQGALQIALDGTLAQGAQVVYLLIPGEGHCRSCGALVALATLYELCPHCQGYPVQPTGGQELRVKDVLLEFPASAPVVAHG